MRPDDRQCPVSRAKSGDDVEITLFINRELLKRHRCTGRQKGVTDIPARHLELRMMIKAAGMKRFG